MEAGDWGEAAAAVSKDEQESPRGYCGASFETQASPVPQDEGEAFAAGSKIRKYVASIPAKGVKGVSPPQIWDHFAAYLCAKKAVLNQGLILLQMFSILGEKVGG
jgi:hypothetical protein